MNYCSFFFSFLICLRLLLFDIVDAKETLVYSIDLDTVKYYNNSNPNLNSNFKEDYPQKVVLPLLLDDPSYGGIPVYDLNLVLIKTIPSSSIYISCYRGDLQCLESENKTLSTYEHDMLSLYASFINSCGTTNIEEDYGLGLIRSMDTENIMGMYSEGFNTILPNKAFHIRLTTGNLYSHVYDHPRLVARIVALLELACHERSHYDKPNWSHTYAHSNEFQTNYNSIFHRAIRNLHSFESLYHHIHANHLHRVADVVWIFVLIIFIVLAWSVFVW